MNSIQRAQEIGQEIWLDNIRRGMLKSGELKRLIDAGISGLTANPTILEKAILQSDDYDEALLELAGQDWPPAQIYEKLAVEDIQASCDMFRPIYDRTRGKAGFASLEISPLLAYSTEETIRESRRLFKVLDRPNVFVKVPATEEGIPAIMQLISEGINVNVTLIFSVKVYEQVIEAYLTGIEELVRKGGNASKVASVASFFLSRIDTMVDRMLEQRILAREQGLDALLGTAAVSSAKLAYQTFKRAFGGDRFARLQAKGATVQRPLWASTSTKNPRYSDVKYVEPLIGPNTVNTMPLQTIQAFLDHGKAGNTIELGVEEARKDLETLAEKGIDIEEVGRELLSEGVKAFCDSFEQLMTGIESKKAAVRGGHAWPGTALGELAGEVQATITELVGRDIVSRIWRKDYSVWSTSPEEITNRLGWLELPDTMMQHVGDMRTFAEEVKSDGFSHAVVLGMGGSSLSCEVFAQTFGRTRGYPELIVLDSTLPEAIKAVEERIDPGKTLFILSSKSGTTIEAILLFRHFHELVRTHMRAEYHARNFVCITDPGTPFVELAGREGFRRTFLNPADVGGRYSALSYFGLVPAAISGMDPQLVLEQARRMKEECGPARTASNNPGLWWGACLGASARRGRNKLTIVASPSVRSFGIWAEQLIAESTGKSGTGIIPVVNEPLVDPRFYGNDRLFFYLRLDNDDNHILDAFIRNIGEKGHPVAVQRIKSKYELGAEFFRWEFATAVAGAILGIHPFNQPDVQSAKDATARVLRQHNTLTRMLQDEPSDSLSHLLNAARPGRYLAIMAFLPQTSEIEAALQELRAAVMERYRIATTVGYGPRFLHSTGQLHKGGPDSGLFYQITSRHLRDIPVPGESYTFGYEADAQAMGDLEALEATARNVAWIRLSRGNADEIRRITESLKEAVRR